MLRAKTSTDSGATQNTATGVSNEDAKKTEKKDDAKNSLRKTEKLAEKSGSMHAVLPSAEVNKMSSRTQAETVASAVGSAEGTKQANSKKNGVVATAELQQRMGSSPQTGASSRPVEIDTRNMNMFQKMLAERNQAKKEEGEYLKIRKQQLLKDLLPQTKGARLRRSDEKFPSHQLKAMEKWNFGAMKAKYMSIRPSGKYATWFGKKHDEKHKHEKCITIKERVLTARKTAPEQQNQKKNKPAKATGKANVPKSILLPQAPPPLPEESAISAPEDLFDEEDCMTNTRYSRPFNDKGVLFWLEEGDNVETEDEETIVNLDSVVKDGELAQKQCYRYAPLRKSIGVDMANALETLMKLDKMYDHSNVYLNTIACVINLTPVEEKIKENKGKKEQRKVVFKDKMVMSEYPADGNTAKATTETKPLKDIVKIQEKE